MKKSCDKLNFLIATVFGIGKIPFAPGTFGSIATFPIIWLFFVSCSYLFVNIFPSNFPALNFIYSYLACWVFLVILFFIGWYSANKYEQMVGGKDPKEVVIDEVVGQGITFLLCWPSIFIFDFLINKLWLVFVLSFVLFRLFDIIKPWPISWADQKIKGGLGIMIDDVIAGLMAPVIFYAIFVGFFN
jgi:phosphatidylglycerophosphatase A